MIANIGQTLMDRELRDFEIDEHNREVLRFLLLYFNGSKEADGVFPDEDYKINKNIMLIGEPGTGKTLLMQIFSDYLKLTGNSRAFDNISSTQLLNYYKMHGHIDKYTYNEAGGGLDGSPFDVCINDIGLGTEMAKSYGTQLTSVMDEFLFARYEIFQQMGIKYHITSNLSVKDLKERFDSRLIDRFKSFNVLELHGGSRR